MSVIECFRDGVKTIKINRPERKNAFDHNVYTTLTKILNTDAENEEIVVTILTGEGDYFSSGNDLKSALSMDFEVALKAVSDMIEAFINYPKLLICVVNGVAIGIAATIVALCDIVYASEDAVFDTPFVRLGLCVEGCSSVNYPQILGRSVTSEMVFFGRKLKAKEACDYGLVSKVIPKSELPHFIESLHQYGKLPMKNVIRNKSAIMANFKSKLLEANKREFEVLRECVLSEEFSAVMQNFMNRKSKL